MPNPHSLTVIYDDRCELCQRCRQWLQRSAQLMPIGFVAASDEDAVHRLGLDPAIVPVGDELIVVGHTSAVEPVMVWVGPDAFITCLWALAEHRNLSARLQRPTLRPVAKGVFHALSLGRGTVSAALSGSSVPSGPICLSEACDP